MIALSDFWDYLNSLFNILGFSVSFGALIVALLIVVFTRQITGFAHTYFAAVVKAKIQKTILDKTIDLAVEAQIDYLESCSRGAILNDVTKEADRCTIGLFKAITLVANIVFLLSYFILLCGCWCQFFWCCQLVYFSFLCFGHL